jgi:hypothetical protein
MRRGHAASDSPLRRIERRDEQLLEEQRVDPIERPVLADQSFPDIPTDVVTIARAFILPLRVCRQ